MRFSGHETFSIREGWLHKGLSLLMSEPQKLFNEDAADWLGVGRNMAKSIRYWLETTGLAEHIPGGKARRQPYLRKTPFGCLVWEKDPYLVEIGTWWALHVNLINSPELATTWAWFFNTFIASRFERSVCIENLRRYLQMAKRQLPSVRTLERDVACLLRSYARPIPQEQQDPEEALDCPLVELGLLSFFKASGYYQVHQGIKDVPPHIFGYCIATAFKEAREGNPTADIPLAAVTRQPGGPAKAFCLTNESLFEVALRLEGELPSGEISIAGLAGDRIIRLRCQSPLDWLTQYYAETRRRDKDVA